MCFNLATAGAQKRQQQRLNYGRAIEASGPATILYG